MKRFLLLGVMVSCLCMLVAADTQSDRVKDETFPEKDGILQLKKGNVNRALRKHKQLLVHFRTRLTVEGHRVSAAFEGAAEELQGSEVKLARVDVTEEKDLAKKLNFNGHPIKLYLSGDINNPAACPVPQSSASILTWLKRRAGSISDLITNINQSELPEELTVVGFFKDLNHEYVQEFYAAAIDLPDVSFAVTQNDDVINSYGLTQDAVLLLKKVLKLVI